MANSKDIDKSSNVNTEKLLPVINFTNAVSEEKATSRLRRTFSVDHTSKKVQAVQQLDSMALKKQSVNQKSRLLQLNLNQKKP